MSLISTAPIFPCPLRAFITSTTARALSSPVLKLSPRLAKASPAASTMLEMSVPVACDKIASSLSESRAPCRSPVLPTNFCKPSMTFVGSSAVS